jgi:hypothetical protein
MRNRNIRDPVELSDTPSPLPSPYILWHLLLQYRSPDPPPLLAKETAFAEFPLEFERMPDFPLDVVPGWKGWKLVQGEYDGVERFVLMTPEGNKLAPHSQARRVIRTIDGKSFNVLNLLASVLLRRNVTNNQYRVLVVENGLWVESNKDRKRLRDDKRRKALIKRLRRVELKIIDRPKSTPIDVRGKGYYVQGGKIYNKYGRALSIHPRLGGRCSMNTRSGRKHIGVGWVLFNAYPDFYGFDDQVHKEADHIDGNHKNNAANNFRPVTTSQNRALRVYQEKRK